MDISTNLFATLLLFCVSVKFELAIQFSPLRFTFLCVSLCGTCFDMGVESRDGGVYNRPGHASLKVTSSITTDPGTVIEQRHAGGSVSFNVKKMQLTS